MNPTSTGRTRRSLLFALAAVCLTIGMGARAYALNFDDVVALYKSGVDENVIIKMAEADKTLYITYEQANQLIAMGASKTLVDSLRPRPTGGGNPGVVVEKAPPPPTPGAVRTEVVDMPIVSTVLPPGGVETVTTTVVEAGVASADGQPIVPVQVARATVMPSLYAKEGWLSVMNRDWIPYYLNIDFKRERMFLSKNPNGGALIQSGQNLILNIRKDGYKLYGDSGRGLEVKIREGETTTLSLEPFGVFGNSGLTGVAATRDKVRSEVLFNNYVPPPPVVVMPAPAPVVVVPAYPPPPPVYYTRPPYYYRDRGWNGIYFEYSR